VEAARAELVERGACYWWRPRGFSMLPTVGDGERVLIAPVSPSSLRLGHVVKFRLGDDELRLHRLVARGGSGGGAWFVFRGDNAPEADPAVGAAALVGLALAVERGDRQIRLDGLLARWRGRIRIWRHRRHAGRGERHVPAG
jgi:hypothetical protein